MTVTKAISFICFDFKRKNLRKQPWNYIQNLAIGLKNKGYEIFILTNKENGDTTNDIIVGLRIVRFNQFQHFFWGVSKSVIQFLKLIDPQCVFILHGPTSYYQINRIPVTMNPVCILGVPLQTLNSILRVNFKDYLEANTHLLSLLLGALTPKTIMKRVFSYYSHIIVLTEDSKRNIEHLGVESKKITKILPGFSRIVESGTNEIMKNKDTKPYLLFFGSPLSIRGINLIVQAFKEISQNRNDIDLYILSRIDNNRAAGSHRKLINQISKYELENNVTVVSRALSEEEIYKYIDGSIFVILPFKIIMSAFPISILETMSLGKAVISTSLPGIRRVLSKNRGILVKPGDLNDLFQKCWMLLENKTIRMKIGKNAEIYMKDIYPKWEDSVELVIRIITSL